MNAFISGFLALIVLVGCTKKDNEREMPATKAERANEDPLAKGKRLFNERACVGCHSLSGQTMIGPALNNIWGTEVELADGTKVKRNKDYFVKSILDPNAEVVKGYRANLMPPYEGQFTDSDIEALVLFIEKQSAKN